MVNKQKILIVDDDENIAELISLYLTKECFDTRIVHDGESALQAHKTFQPDMILLDIMLPRIDGYQVCRELRTYSNTPIIMLSAKGEVFDKVLGLELGADDYIVKPFAFEELMARIRCICRRPVRLTQPDLLRFGDLIYDTEQNLLSCGSKSCSLSRREGDLFALFLRNPGQTLPRTTILMRVWGPETEIEEGNLDNYIHFFRRRLKAVNSRVQLSTVRGVGYRLIDPA